MQIRLSARAEAFVRQIVIEGRYKSADAVVDDALEQLALQLLRADIREGLKGKSTPWDVNEVKRALLRRVSRKSKAS
jgi:putative addiction module CopG family antidote